MNNPTKAPMEGIREPGKLNGIMFAGKWYVPSDWHTKELLALVERIEKAQNKPYPKSTNMEWITLERHAVLELEEINKELSTIKSELEGGK